MTSDHRHKNVVVIEILKIFIGLNGEVDFMHEVSPSFQVSMSLIIYIIAEFTCFGVKKPPPVISGLLGHSAQPWFYAHNPEVPILVFPHRSK